MSSKSWEVTLILESQAFLLPSQIPFLLQSWLALNASAEGLVVTTLRLLF